MAGSRGELTSRQILTVYGLAAVWILAGGVAWSQEALQRRLGSIRERAAKLWGRVCPSGSVDAEKAPTGVALISGFEPALIGFAWQGYEAVAVYNYQTALGLIIDRTNSTMEEAVSFLDESIVQAGLPGDYPSLGDRPSPVWLDRELGL